jgi:hypothetical protein
MSGGLPAPASDAPVAATRPLPAFDGDAWIGLFHDDGVELREVDDGSYARACLRDIRFRAEVRGGLLHFVNEDEVVFFSGGRPWGVVTHFGIMAAARGECPLLPVFRLGTPVEIGGIQATRFAPGSLSFQQNP